MLFYDVTRLLSRLNKSTPTGIDRVDVHYCSFLIDNFKNIYFVHWYRGQLHLINKIFIVAMMGKLKAQWISGQKSNLAPKLTNLSLDINRHKNKMSTWINKGLISSQLRKLLTECDDPVYINTSHTNLNRDDLFIEFESLSVKSVILIHDMIPITHPEYCRHGDDLKHEIRILNVLKYSDMVFTNSKYTRKCLLDFAEQHQINYPVHKIIVNQLGTENLAKYIDCSWTNFNTGNKPYFIAIGTIEPRKNYLLLLNAWRRLAEDLGNECPVLYIVGKRGWVNAETIAMLERCKVIQPYVKELNNIEDVDLSNLLYNSNALLMPSYVEGWGMPVTEALSMGVNVICSDIEVFHENTHGACTLLPHDTGLWYSHIKNMYDVKNKKMKVVEGQSWINHFDSMKKALNLL